MCDVQHQLRDYWSDVVADHPLPSTEELIDGAGADGVAHRTGAPVSDNGTTPAVGDDREILVAVERQPDSKEHIMSTRRWMLIGAAAAVILIVVIAAMIVRDDDPSQTGIVDTPDPTVETTAAPASSTTEAPVPETMEVSFYLLDSRIPPDQFTCLSAPSNFDVEFIDEAGESTVASAVTERFFAPSIEDPPINTTCTDVVAAADGQPAILFSAVIEAPAADTYQSISVNYVFGDVFEVFFEDVTRAEAEAGLYLEYGDDVTRVIGPEDIEALQLAE